MDLVGNVRGQGLAQDHALVPDHGLVHEISDCLFKSVIFHKSNYKAAGQSFIYADDLCLTQWRIQSGVAGLQPPLNLKKRAVTSMAVVMDLVVTSYSPDFLSEGPFQHCPLEHQHVVCTG